MILLSALEAAGMERLCPGAADSLLKALRRMPLAEGGQSPHVLTVLADAAGEPLGSGLWATG
jgi:hypothetical protein